MSRTNFHGPEDVPEDVEVRLYNQNTLMKQSKGLNGDLKLGVRCSQVLLPVTNGGSHVIIQIETFL